MQERIAQEETRRKKGEEELRAEKADRERVERGRVEAEKTKQAGRRRGNRRILAAVVALLTVAAVAVLLLTDTVKGTNSIVYLVIGASLLLSGAGYLAFNRDKMNALVGVISLAGGFGGLALALLTTN